MKIYKTNIEETTLNNSSYRKVLYTSKYSQLVVMNIKPGEEIGNEIHGLDQFIRVEKGSAKIVIDNGKETHELIEDWAVIIPSGTYHNVINTGNTDLKLYTIYSPPAHLKNTHQKTKKDEVEDHFDGIVDS